jgi:NADH-quinone oxidoreductase subunit L
MAAGSVIAAMAGQQDIDRMSGFRRAMPLTFIGFLVAALALGAFPGFSGYFSKDDILAFAAERGGGYWWIYAAGTLGALLTAIYAFRMVFRCFWGPPCPEARELEQGHLHHAEPFNPATGEKEDTDVGYPGPEHHIAEREPSMAVPILLLAALSVFGGVVQIPGVTHVIERFLEPTFSDSRFVDFDVSGGIQAFALILGAVASLLGIGIAYVLWVQAPGTTVDLARRVPRLHGFLTNKWYFDELYDLVFVRPVRALGQGASRTFERVVVDSTVGSASVVVRIGNSIVRVAQSGLVRYYALLLLVGVGGLVLYFLVVSQ